MSVSSRRQRERAERRQAILDAASEVFLRKGYAQATMGEVAALAELSKGTLYLYFKNKDDLFLALSAVHLSGTVARFQEIAGGDARGVEKIRAMLLAYAAQAQGHPDHFRSVVVFLTGGHRADTSTPTFITHRGYIDELMSALIGAIEQGQADGSVRAELNPLPTVGQLWGGMFGAIQINVNRDELNRRFPKPIEFDDFLEGYVDILVEGLRHRADS